MVLELRLLPDRHPTPNILGYGAATILRLSIDPTAIASEATSRVVRIDWVRRPGGCSPQEVVREISWQGVPNWVLDASATLPFTKNASAITEEAAIGVMALLIDDLEDAEILTVLPIGSGGDYQLLLRGLNAQTQVECSGIHIDERGYESTARLKQKPEQVRTISPNGFASVTAFSHSASRDVRCKISFVGEAI